MKGSPKCTVAAIVLSCVVFYLGSSILTTDNEKRQTNEGGRLFPEMLFGFSHVIWGKRVMTKLSITCNTFHPLTIRASGSSFGATMDYNQPHPGVFNCTVLWLTKHHHKMLTVSKSAAFQLYKKVNLW